MAEPKTRLVAFKVYDTQGQEEWAWGIDRGPATTPYNVRRFSTQADALEDARRSFGATGLGTEAIVAKIVDEAFTPGCSERRFSAVLLPGAAEVKPKGAEETVSVQVGGLTSEIEKQFTATRFSDGWAIVESGCITAYSPHRYDSREQALEAAMRISSNVISSDPINHPAHYNTGKIEVIDAIEDWRLGFNDGNAVKYIARARHKGKQVEDLRKALWYITREIEGLEKAKISGE